MKLLGTNYLCFHLIVLEDALKFYKTALKHSSNRSTLNKLSTNLRDRSEITVSIDSFYNFSIILN